MEGMGSKAKDSNLPMQNTRRTGNSEDECMMETAVIFGKCLYISEDVVDENFAL